MARHPAAGPPAIQGALMTTAPRPEQLVAFAKGAPSDGPIHMLNLLEFKGLAHQKLVHCQPPDAGATPFAR